jgi:hypothetical protein
VSTLLRQKGFAETSEPNLHEDSGTPDYEARSSRHALGRENLPPVVTALQTATRSSSPFYNCIAALLELAEQDHALRRKKRKKDDHRITKLIDDVSTTLEYRDITVYAHL